jgi:glyoxylase-like metal-dependent hydrolase (beta-lactamase superfamily II)
LTLEPFGERRAMRIHHLNCGTFCPIGGPLMDGASRGPLGRLVCHCLLIETDRGLVLIDTGLGLQDTTHTYPRLSRFYVNLLNIQLDPEQTAIRQIQRLGFNPADVRHIVLTHLDFDHAGGLEDFPQATVHLMSAELDAAARRRRGFVASRRYRPMQWDDVTRWRRYDGGGEPWYGFSAVRGLDGLPPEILLIPLPGHTWGHAGIAIDAGGHWLLHAGDAYFYRGEMAPKRHCTPGLRAYQRLMEVDRQARLANQERLRRLAVDKWGEVRLFCAHDPVEFERLHVSGPAPAAARV